METQMRMDNNNSDTMVIKDVHDEEGSAIIFFLDLDGFYRGKSRGVRGKFHQQSNGGDSQSNQQVQPNDNYVSQQRSRGPGGGYRGRPRGNNRGGRGGHDRNYLPQQQLQDSTADGSTPSDTTQQVTDVSHPHRRGGSNAAGRPQQDHQWDVGNWNGETLIYLRTTKEEEEQATAADSNGVPNSSNALAGGEIVTQSLMKTMFVFFSASAERSIIASCSVVDTERFWT